MMDAGGKVEIQLKKKGDPVMKKNRGLSLFGFLVVWAIIMIGIAPAALAKGAELVVAEGTEIGQLDPHKARSMQDLTYGNAIFDTLLKNPAGEVKPNLAVSYKLVDDTTWEFKLRKGVRFHNGDTFTAKDVKFSFDRMLDPETKNPFRSLYATIKETTVVDEYTVRIMTTNPDPILEKRLCMTAWIIPSDYIREHGIDKYLEKPIGTGPYRFVKWVKNDYLLMDSNKDYWGGAPKLEKVTFRPIPEAAARLAALELGEVDIVTNVPPFLIPQLKAKDGIDIQSVLSGRIMLVNLNTSENGQEPLRNQKVRQALNYAVDKQLIIKKILMGSAIQRSTILTNYHFGYDPGLDPYPYDPEKAKALLAEAGYPEGFELDFVTPSGRYLMDKEVSEAICGMLNKVGVKTDLRVMETGTWIQAFLSRKLKGAYLVGWGNMFDDAEGTYSNFWVEQAPVCIYKTPIASQVEKLIVEARTEMNKEKRKGIYFEIQRLTLEDAPMIFLYQLKDNYAVRDRVQGFEAVGREVIWLHDVSVK
jgi:peptide/nickel transport system substrate-binding protein